MPRDDTPLDFFGNKDDFATGQRMALMLSRASIVPDTYRGHILKNDQWVENPDAVGNCFIALELANRLKVSPIMVMQQVDVIYGRPSLRGTFLIGLVNGSKQFTQLAFEQAKLPPTDPEYGYRCMATNLSTGLECVGPWITNKMVAAEGWAGKTGSKWKSMPELMFQYRAAAFWSRLFAPHITLGLYEADEAREVFGVEDERSQRAISAPAAASAVASLAQELANASTAAATAGNAVEKEAKPAKPKKADKAPAPDAGGQAEPPPLVLNNGVPPDAAGKAGDPPPARSFE
jgi:hypothetical protein